MALYAVLALSALVLGPWLLGFAISAWIDASRPKEVEPPVPPAEDRLALVQRLADEWKEVGGHWISCPESDEDHRAA